MTVEVSLLVYEKCGSSIIFSSYGNVMDPTDEVLRTSSVHKWLLQKTYNDALIENEKSATHWKKYKEDHEALIKNLMFYRDKLSHSIMIPLGTKAFMKGKLRNTNEILISLGDSWFTKQSSSSAVELCIRRIKYCDELLEKLSKEQKLLESGKIFPLENETFGDDRIPEIIEPYNEEAEKEWRLRHREKEHEYRKKLAELKKQAPSKIETEEDLWKHLDALDLQEKLEEELDRLNEDEEGSISSDESDESEADDRNNVVTHIYSRENETQSEENNETYRVSFSNESEVRHFKDDDCSIDVIKKEADNNDEYNEPIRISFVHSPVKIEIDENCTDEIGSPSDIYSKFSHLFNKTPKSILKKSSKDYSHSDIGKTDNKENVIEVMSNDTRQKTQPLLQSIGDVVEHKDPVVQPVNTRPVSKFKAARLAAKR